MYRLGLLLLIAVLVPGLHYLHLFLDKSLPRKIEIQAEYRLPPPAFLQVVSLGHDSLIADLLWLQAIQYYGGSVQENKTMPQLYQYFDAVTTLDPDFVESYIFASFVLADVVSKSAAEKILQKGLAANPDNWSIPYQLGFLNYLYFKNKLQAAKYFEMASRKEGAPNYLGRMAAQLYTQTGASERCQVAPRLWANAREQATEPATRERAEQHLIELKIACDLQTLRDALAKYRAQAERPPARNLVIVPEAPYPRSLNELLTRGLISQLPFDPFRRPYLYQPAQGTVKAYPPPWKKLVELKPEDIVR